MRSLKILMTAALVLGTVSAVQAELQNVELDGSIRIRGNFYDWDDNLAINGGEDQAWVEQRTRLGVKADFTDDVSTYIEFDAYNNWGDSFRSNYVTGIDAAGGSEIDLYQAYIEVNNAWGLPIRSRIGRQEIEFGSEWLLGNNDTAALYTGLSFDGFRTTYANDSFTVDFLSLKMGETFQDFADGDVNLWGLYGSYIGLEDWQFDLYWLFVQEDDVRNVANATGLAGAVAGGFIPALPVSDDADLHTIGLRGAGTYGAFDLEAEVAFQFGEIERRTNRFGFFRFLDNSDDLDYDAWAFNLEGGYTFDMTWTPRVYLGVAFFEGGDDNDNNLIDRIFGTDGDDLAFNRLFSNWEYSEFIENTALSNAIIYRGGISAMPTEKISLLLALSYFEADEENNLNNFGLGIFDFFDNGDDDELGWEVGLYADYQYSEDLVFRAGFAHYFGDDGIDDGNFVTANGLGQLFHIERSSGFLGRLFGDNDEDDGDYNYLFWEAEISF